MFHGKWAPVLLAACAATLLIMGCTKSFSLLVLTQGPGSVVWDPSGNPHTAGTEITITAVPTAGAHFDHWSGALSGNANPASITLNADTSVTATFAPDSFTLTYIAGNGGAITGPTPQTVNYGTDGVEVIAAPDMGHHFVQWSDGITTPARTDTTVTADLGLTADFALDKQKLTYTAGEHGVITGLASQTVDYGTDGAQVTAAPDTVGYHFVQWSDGVTTPARTDMGVKADLNITAEFALDKHTLTYTAGEHGGITGSTPQSVDYGANGEEVTAAPNTGYHFVQWSDGITKPARTDASVTADLSVTASFAINVYTLSYGTGENGTLSGEPSQTVNHGDDGTAVTAMPNEGCHFVQWSDGLTTATRTDRSVGGDITVSAEFGVGIVLHVDADSTAAAPDGMSWATAYSDLQSAVDAAPANAHVWVAEGRYTATGDAVLNMRAAVALYGGFSGTEVYRDQRDWNARKSIIDGQEARRGVMGADNATLDGFTVTRGSAESGAGVFINGTSPVIAHCVFTGNYATIIGGGLVNSGGVPLIEDCVFRGNTAKLAGGGMYCDGPGGTVLRRCLFEQNSTSTNSSQEFGGAIVCYYSSLTMNECVVRLNSSSRGGGLAGIYGTLTLQDCVFSENLAQSSAGAIAIAGGTAAADDCIFMQNSAMDGGALDNSEGDWTLNNCVFQENSAAKEGGAIQNSLGSLNARNCTFTQNSAKDGGALCSATQEHLVNCILWGDTATDAGQEIQLKSLHLLSVTYSCVQGGFAGPGNINTAPLFVDADGGSLYLKPVSPCLDAGTATDAPATDLLGRPRPQGSGVDMGAYEGASSDLVTLTVQVSPAEGGTTWPAAGTHQYPRGARVLLAATPSGMRFTGWTGDLTGGASTAFIFMNADKTVTAEFAINVVYVNAAGKGVPDGTSWTTAFHDIQSAVDAAPSDNSGEIWVAEGTYTSTAAQVVTMKRGVLIYGGFAGTENSRAERDWCAHVSVIDGEGARRGVTGADDAVLDGFTVTRGQGFPHGGGMWNEGCAPVVRHCLFLANTAMSGGGMGNMSTGTAPIIEDCIFRENQGDDGGGIFYGDSPAHLVHCILERNNARMDGGGLAQNGGTTTLSDCLFQENSAGTGGGAWDASGAAAVLERCVFLRNSTTYGSGGGLYEASPNATLRNCVFQGNSATGSQGYGGGLAPHPYGTTVQLVNCTFTQNVADFGGACGTYPDNSTFFTVPNMTNCILWGDRAQHGPGEIAADNVPSLAVSHCCIQGGYPGSGNIDTDPLFVDGNGGSIQLSAGSPCLDAGTTDHAPNIDLLGRPRPQGIGVDMGAYEGAPAPEDLLTLTLAASPAGAGHARPELGTHTFVRGETARVKAFPLGMRFIGWTGDAQGSAVDIALAMDADKILMANFVPNVLYANAAHIGPSDGRSWATAFRTVAEAINTAAADTGGEVWVAAGNYYSLGTYSSQDKEARVMHVLSPGVFMYGGFAGTETARDQRDWNRNQSVLMGGGKTPLGGPGAVCQDDSALDGFVLTRGNSGLLVHTAAPLIANCVMHDNMTGISVINATPTVVNCTFLQNDGGMSNDDASPALTACTFSKNTYYGMRNSGGAPEITGCVFSENTGGGMVNQSSAARVTNCIFRQNSAASGGGVRDTGGGTMFMNCTFTQNTATGTTSNAGRGGGYLLEAGTSSMTNCIVWGNTAEQGPEVFVAAGTLTARYSCMPLGYGDDGTFYLNPHFVDAVNGNVRLLPDSSCINTGTAVGAPATDIEGTPRPQGAGVDIGAYER